MRLGAELFEHPRRFIAGLAAGAQRVGNDLSFDQPTVGPPSHVRDVVHARRPRTARHEFLRQRLPHARAHHGVGIGIEESIAL